MPQAIAFAITAGASSLLSAAGASVAVQAVAGQAIAGALLSGVGQFAINTALSVGATAIAQRLFAPKPKPTETQQEIKQAIPPKHYVYGEVKKSGPLAFFASRETDLHDGRIMYKLPMLAAHPIDSIQKYYLDDREVVLDPLTNEVITAPLVINGYRMARIFPHLGEIDQLADAMMVAEWAGIIDSNFRLRGTAYLAGAFEQPGGPEQFSRVYPSGRDPNMAALIRGKRVYDPRKDSTVAGGSGTHRANDPTTWGWSDNVALVALDYLRWERVGYAITLAELSIPSFMAMADLCDEAVPLGIGGTEKRYRIAMTFFSYDSHKSVLRRILEACNGMLYKTPAGQWAIRGGRWDAPVVHLDERESRFKQFDLGEPEAIDRYNKLNISCMVPANGYVEQECDPWTDPFDIALNGEKPQSLDLTQVPSYTQARRLAKIRFNFDNPELVASIRTDFYGLDCIGQPTVAISKASMGFDEEVFWIEDSPKIAEDFATTSMTLRLANEFAYAWTTDEEGAAPPVPPDTGDDADLLLAGVGEYLQASSSATDYMRFR